MIFLLHKPFLPETPFSTQRKWHLDMKILAQGELLNAYVGTSSFPFCFWPPHTLSSSLASHSLHLGFQTSKAHPLIVSPSVKDWSSKSYTFMCFLQAVKGWESLPFHLTARELTAHAPCRLCSVTSVFCLSFTDVLKYLKQMGVIRELQDLGDEANAYLFVLPSVPFCIWGPHSPSKQHVLCSTPGDWLWFHLVESDYFVTTVQTYRPSN